MKKEYTILTIPRARRVHQPLIATVPTVVMSFSSCVNHVTIQPKLSEDSRPFADVLILNGPGTCFVLCAAVYVNKVRSCHIPLIPYCEWSGFDEFASVFWTPIA
jgi:beta-1,4-N-acetylglucosaminyltransferase